MEKVFLCNLDKFLEKIEYEDLDDPMEFAMQFLSHALNNMGYDIIGNENELWAVKKKE